MAPLPPCSSLPSSRKLCLQMCRAPLPGCRLLVIDSICKESSMGSLMGNRWTSQHSFHSQRSKPASSKVQHLWLLPQNMKVAAMVIIQLAHLRYSLQSALMMAACSHRIKLSGVIQQLRHSVVLASKLIPTCVKQGRSNQRTVL